MELCCVHATAVLQYVFEDASGNAVCVLCEPGKDCTDPLHSVVVVNHWASLASFQQGVFYSCPIAGACLGGMNASGFVELANSSVFQLVRDGEVLNHCDGGYVGLLCSASSCDDGSTVHVTDVHPRWASRSRWWLASHAR